MLLVHVPKEARSVNRELAAKEERRRRLTQSAGNCGDHAVGYRVLPALPRLELTQALPPPLADALGTAVYLITFFYIFAFWPIQSLVERLLDAR